MDVHLLMAYILVRVYNTSMFESFEKAKIKKDERPPLTGQEFKLGNLPGTDTFDDGLINGELKMPGSTSTESGGMYMEHKGPNDLVQNLDEERTKAEFEMVPGIHITDGSSLEIVSDDVTEDAADKWLRENDPKYKH